MDSDGGSGGFQGNPVEVCGDCGALIQATVVCQYHGVVLWLNFLDIQGPSAGDAQAAALLEEFEAGSEETLEATLPMTERQSLYVRFQREADGTVTVLDWRTVTAEEEADVGSNLPVYGSEDR